ncbi:MAG: Proton/sodium-glutamate symport protein [Holosporales bacterium]
MFCCVQHPLSAVIALLLGVIAGLLNIGILNQFAHVVADIFMRLLKLLSLPVISFSLLATLSGLGNWKTLQNLGGRVIRYTLLTTVIAASVAAILYGIFQPRINAMQNICDLSNQNPNCSYTTHLANIIPSNILQPFVEHNVIGVLFIAIFFGLGILSLPEEKRKVVHQLLDGIFESVMNMIRWVVYFMPLAVFAFVVEFVHELKFVNTLQKDIGLSSLGLYVSLVVAANLIQAIVVLPVLLKMKGIPVLRTAKGMAKALSLAFFSKSSAAAMPVAMECAQHLKADPNVVRFSFPLCTTINMNACAAFIYITVLFVSSSHGIEFSFSNKLMYILVATIAAVGNAGVPMGCFFLSSALLTTMGVPITLMGVILPVYALIDMLESAINIWSDACVTLIVNEDIKNAKA